MRAFEITGIRYDADDGRRSDEGQILVSGGSATVTFRFLRLGSHLSMPASQAIGDLQPVEFTREVRIQVFAGGVRIGGFVVRDDLTPAGNGPYQRMGTNGRFLTLSYRVVESASNSREPTAQPPASSSAAIARLARNSTGVLRPDEAGLIFSPLHYRRHLVDEADAQIPTGDPRRERVKQLITEHPTSRRAFWSQQWQIDGETLKLKEVGDAREFEKGAIEFRRYYGGLHTEYFKIDNGLDRGRALGGPHEGEGDESSYSDRLGTMLDHINGYTGPTLSFIAFFCHGWKNGFQLGIGVMGAGGSRRHPSDVERLVESIKGKARDDLVLVLYACGTAKEDEASFAARLRDLMVGEPHPKPHCRVVGHYGDGNAYQFPFIRVFEGSDGTGAAGHDIAPSIEIRQRLKSRISNASACRGFRWAFPFMTLDAIDAYLADPSPHPQLFRIPGE